MCIRRFNWTTHFTSKVNLNKIVPNLIISTINLAARAVATACSLEVNVEYLLCHKDILAIELVETLDRVMHYCTPAADLCLHVASSLMQALSKCLQPESSTDSKLVHIKESIIGFVILDQHLYTSYILSIDFVDKIRNFYIIVHGPVSPGSPLLSFLKESMSLIQAITLTRVESYFLKSLQRTQPDRAKDSAVYTEKTVSATTINHDSLVKSLFSTDLVCIITMLDALLLHKGGPTKLAVDECLDDDMITISLMGIKTLNQAANLDLKMTQACLKL